MTQLATPATERLVLPSDQDASGRSFDEEELALLREVLDSGTLTSTKGTKVPALEERFADLIGVDHAVACASGSAAVHCAVAALDLEPGDEVVTTSVTDMGALAPILYQGAIPVFADLDPDHGVVTAGTVEAVLSERTRAVIATHLFGLPVDLPPLVALTAERGLILIEDSAQAFLASSDGRFVGSVGALGTFSLQQGKHITSGEGGLVTTDDAGLARAVRLFVNKAWGYGDPDPDHRSLALNYRLSELQAAVALAQLAKLPASVRKRIELADLLTERLAGLPGIGLPGVLREHDVHSYWRYPLLVDPAVVPGGPSAVAGGLREFGVPSAPRYIQKPAFRCGVFADQKTFGTSRWPFTLARPEAVDYAAERFPGTFAFLDRVLVLLWNERYERHHVEALAEAIRAAVTDLTGQR